MNYNTHISLLSKFVGYTLKYNFCLIIQLIVPVTVHVVFVMIYNYTQA